MYKVSIIIPIYNVEKYFKACMDSILNQTIGFENIQVIMVDDCSTDNSYNMAQEYSKKYSNCISLQLESCSGVAGKPRNEGLKHVEGKYIMFTDPDDFYSLDACEILYNNMEEKNADFIVANWINADEDGTPWENPIFNLEKYKPFKLSIDDFKDSFFVMNSSVCNKIFNSEFVKDNNLHFLEGVPAEDAYFTMSSFVASKNVYYIDNVMYYYRQRDKNGLSISFDCSRDYFKKINTAYRAIYEMFVENKQIKFYRFLYARNMTYMLYKFIDSSLLSDEDRIEILSDMRWFYKLSVILKVPACQKSLAILINRIIEGEYKDVTDICKIIAEVRSYMPKDIRQNMSKPYDEMYNEMMKIKYEEGV